MTLEREQNELETKIKAKAAEEREDYEWRLQHEKRVGSSMIQMLE